MFDMDIPASWEASAQEIMRHGWRKVLILGDVDRGKSTYGRFLRATLLGAGCRVAVVDSDVGQKDLGPPAALTLGYPTAASPAAILPPAAWYFVGSVTPIGHFLPMVVGVRHLVDAAQAAFVVINTTGFVHGAGRVLKAYKIEAIQPDAVVAIEQGHELQPLLQAYRHYRILRLRPSSHVRMKTPAQRRAAREHAFATYFQPARTVQLSCRQLIFQRVAVPAGLQPGLLCGLADRRNRGLGLGLIAGCDWAGGTLSVFTPVCREHIRILQGGAMYLTPEGVELPPSAPAGAAPG